MERHGFRIVSGESPEACGNCAFPQDFNTRKLDEITTVKLGLDEFYAVPNRL